MSRLNLSNKLIWKSLFNHTPGRWRFEVNLNGKAIELCGGKNPFDVTVMSFVRWGMNGAAPCFNADIRDGKNDMRRANEFACLPVHLDKNSCRSEWFRVLNHPDANLIESAPDIFKACVLALEQLDRGESESAFVILRNAVEEVKKVNL